MIDRPLIDNEGRTGKWYGEDEDPPRYVVKPDYFAGGWVVEYGNLYMRTVLARFKTEEEAYAKLVEAHAGESQ